MGVGKLLLVGENWIYYIMYDPSKPYKKQILELIRDTWHTPYVSIKPGIYPLIEKKFSYPEVDHTDGIGTKGVYHWKRRTFKNAVRDALAMNLNDLLLVRATPYALQNHIVLPEDDHEAILEIIAALSEECKKRNIAITGGETSIHKGSSFDISITVSGFVKNPKPNKFQIDDVLIGLSSAGLHSNGFTKVREVFKDEFREEFVSPTPIYFDTILSLFGKYDVHGMMHITGGAFTKLKDLLDGTDVRVTRDHKLEPQAIFHELYARGIPDREMYRTFNCGIGFIFSIPAEEASRVLSEIDGAVIGEVTQGSGAVIVESAFSNKIIHFQ